MYSVVKDKEKIIIDPIQSARNILVRAELRLEGDIRDFKGFELSFFEIPDEKSVIHFGAVSGTGQAFQMALLVRITCQWET